GNVDLDAGWELHERGDILHERGDRRRVERDQRERIGRDGDAAHEEKIGYELCALSAAVAISAISRACSVDSRASAERESFSSSVNPASSRNRRARWVTVSFALAPQTAAV